MGSSDDNAGMRLLLTGDLHLGRSSSRVPEDVNRDELRAAATWSRIVDLALQERVGLVCLSGDIADENNLFWEAIGPLQRGIQHLTEAGIRTVAVAGNHDFEVLARLADQLPPEHFTLLGRGGQWQRITIDGPDHAILHLDGWSFPTQKVEHTPLDSYDFDRDPAVPILGMVHGDLDQTTTPYAPLKLSTLQALPPGGWLLGHVHAPRFEEGPPWVLYPGSPQAFDPGETGAHGPWILQVQDGRIGIPEQRPLSSVWYGHCAIDLTGTQDEAGLERALLNRLREAADRATAEAGPHLVHASLRLLLTGATRLSERVAEEIGQITDDLCLPAGAGSLGVDTVDVQTTPAIDLEETAATRSAPGAVARLLLELDGPSLSDEVAELIRRARSELEQMENHKDFAWLKRRDVTEAMARDHLRTQGRALLTRLAAQTP